MTLPAAPGPEHKQVADKLQKLSGAEFDREYMKHMLDDHKKTSADFEKEARSGSDPAIKAFAAKTLPTLREHLKAAQAADESARGKGAAPQK